MLYRDFGRTGWKVSAIGLGTWNIGNQWGPVDDATAFATVRAAFDHGMNLFDAAESYGLPNGLSEERLGRALAGIRHEVFVVSKIGNWGKRTGQEVPKTSVDMIRLCAHASLHRLRHRLPRRPPLPRGRDRGPVGLPRRLPHPAGRGPAALLRHLHQQPGGAEALQPPRRLQGGPGRLVDHPAAVRGRVPALLQRPADRGHGAGAAGQGPAVGGATPRSRSSPTTSVPGTTRGAPAASSTWSSCGRWTACGSGWSRRT